jgi:hypothetical protein
MWLVKERVGELLRRTDFTNVRTEGMEEWGCFHGTCAAPVNIGTICGCLIAGLACAVNIESVKKLPNQCIH